VTDENGEKEMSEELQFWSFLSVDGDRQHGGNQGYEDAAETNYEYDSLVGNHKQIKIGDIAFVRDREEVSGIAVVKQIEEWDGDKLLHRCPRCKTTGIKIRKTKLPPWRCHKCSLEFEAPAQETVPVKKYSAKFGDSFIPIEGILTANQIKRAALRPSDQNSIEQIDPSAISFSDVQNIDQLRSVIAAGLRRNYRIDVSVPEPLIPVGLAHEDVSDDRDSYLLNTAAERTKTLRAINERRGQAGFRKKLINRYGGRCMVTGTEVVAVIEAAHICPYITEDDNHAENGLLLRSDHHTLFDLDLLGIDPHTFEISVHPEISEEYGVYAGHSLVFQNTNRPSKDALSARWSDFQDRGE
jgi:putative restriction endonuclease